MDELLAMLRDKGYKITPQRRAVITALLAGGQFSTAQQILEFVKQTNPDISLDTVYRNIGLLVELGIVHEIHTKNRDGHLFEIVASGQHHHHLICTECGNTQCMSACPINVELLELAEREEFQITGHLFEVYGKCKKCQKKC